MLCVLHEHSDHYSVQPTARTSPAALNAALTAFLAQPGVARMEAKEAFYAVTRTAPERCRLQQQ